MDIGRALEAVAAFLDQKGYRYAVIGGVALVMYGLPRTTLDLDLVVDFSSQEDLVRFLESLGYQTLHRSSGYSNHSHPDPDRGGLDFVYVQGETGDKLFSSCRQLKGPGNLAVPVPSPEHLAALKVLAMKNDPTRTFQEMADLRFLITLPGVNRGTIRTFFARYDLMERFDELERTL